MCEYCKGKEDISNRKFEDGSRFSDYMVRVWIDDVFNEKMLIVSPVEYESGYRKQYMRYAFNIIYCPMCRKEAGRVKTEQEIKKEIQKHKEAIKNKIGEKTQDDKIHLWIIQTLEWVIK